jgi:hypothetical protein
MFLFVHVYVLTYGFPLRIHFARHVVQEEGSGSGGVEEDDRRESGIATENDKGIKEAMDLDEKHLPSNGLVTLQQSGSCRKQKPRFASRSFLLLMFIRVSSNLNTGASTFLKMVCCASLEEGFLCGCQIRFQCLILQAKQDHWYSVQSGPGCAGQA